MNIWEDSPIKYNLSGLLGEMGPTVLEARAWSHFISGPLAPTTYLSLDIFLIN